MSDVVPHPPVLTFGPDKRLAVAALVGAVVTGVVALALNDRPGKFLFAVATIVLVVHAALNVIYSPRLEVDALGVRIRTPLLRTALAWDEIERVGADSRQRLGLRSTTLEVDAGEVLVVFSRWALGVEPEAAAALIDSMDPRGR